MIARGCLAAGCPSLALKAGYCARHALPPGPHKSFYDSALWQRTRARVLREEPWCECGERTTHVDHKQSLSRGGHPTQRSNLKAYCKRCHGVKTVREDGALARAI